MCTAAVSLSPLPFLYLTLYNISSDVSPAVSSHLSPSLFLFPVLISPPVSLLLSIHLCLPFCYSPSVSPRLIPIVSPTCHSTSYLLYSSLPLCLPTSYPPILPLSLFLLYSNVSILYFSLPCVVPVCLFTFIFPAYSCPSISSILTLPLCLSNLVLVFSISLLVSSALPLFHLCISSLSFPSVSPHCQVTL